MIIRSIIGSFLAVVGSSLFAVQEASLTKAGKPAAISFDPALLKVPPKAPLFFDRDIFPILAEKCQSCHDREAGTAEGKLDVMTVAALRQGGKRGPAIVAGKGAESLIVRSAARLSKPTMPPKSDPPLTPRELTLLRLWIDQGAQPGNDPRPAAALAKEMTLETPNAKWKPVLALDIHPTAPLVIAGHGNELALVELNQGTVLARLGDLDDIVQTVRFAPTGTLLAAGDHGEVKLWKSNPRPVTPDVKPGRLSDMKTAGQATGDRTNAKEKSPPSSRWTPIAGLGPVRGRIASLAFSGDGKYLAAGSGIPSARGDVTVWELPAGKLIRQFTDIHADSILGVAFSPNGKEIASCAGDKFVRIHDLAAGIHVRSFEGHADYVMGVDWRPDGKELVSCGVDGTVRRWSRETGEPAGVIREHGTHVTGIRWVAGVQQVVTSCGDKAARLVDVNGNRVMRSFVAPTDFLQCSAASPDRKWLVAGSEDGKLIQWDLQSAALLRVVPLATH